MSPDAEHHLQQCDQPAKGEHRLQGDPLEMGDRDRSKGRITADSREGGGGGRETKTIESDSLNLHFSQENNLGKTSAVLYANP